MINRIRDIRREKGWTLADLAEACDPPTTAQTIGRLETGMRNLSIKWMDRIGAALGGESGGHILSLTFPDIFPLATALSRSYVCSPSASDLTIIIDDGDGSESRREFFERRRSGLKKGEVKPNHD